MAEPNTPKPKPKKRKRKVTLEDVLTALQAAAIAGVTAYKLLKPYVSQFKKGGKK
jgi:hypothetical protein